jgi:hypothetical protein
LEVAARFFLLQKIQLFSLIVHLNEAFRVDLFAVYGAFPPGCFTGWFARGTRVGGNIGRKILIDSFLFGMVMLHELDEYGDPSILDVMVVAGELPDHLISIGVALRHEGVALIGQGFPDILAFHEVAAIEVDL